MGYKSCRAGYELFNFNNVMKKYKLVLENGKYNVEYYENDILMLKEFHSTDGVNGTVRDGYIDINKSEYALQYLKDKDFGQLMIDTFIVDNREMVMAFDVTVSTTLLNKFNNVKAFAELGDIKTVKALLTNIAIDSVFTQNRKTKYLQMCNNHLGL